MRRDPLAGFLVTVLSSAFALPLAYGAAAGSCAPPGFLCYTGGSLCLAVCTDAWSQFATVAAYGAVVGLAPALLVALLILWIERRKGPRWTASRPLGLPALGIVGMLGTLLLVLAAFPYVGGYLVVLVTGFGIALSVACSGSYLLAERLASGRAPRRGG